MVKKIKLNNGNFIPQLGLGTFLNTNSNEVQNTIKNAISIGYRLFDTAAIYDNEKYIGQEINEEINNKLINRRDLFISSKILAVKNGRNIVEEEYKKSLDNLKLDYLDLFLIHWMPRDYQVLLDTWRGFEDLYLSGKVKNIGICNISLYYLDKLLKDCKVKPQIVQVELHPFLQQDILVNYCMENNIQVMSYGPFAKQKVFENQTIIDLSKKYDRSVGSIIIKWGIQRNLILIPKTTHLERLKSNFNIDFNISNDDMEIIKTVNDGLRVYRDPENNPYTK